MILFILGFQHKGLTQKLDLKSQIKPLHLQNANYELQPPNQFLFKTHGLIRLKRRVPLQNLNAYSMPFFCKIEHDMIVHRKMPIKFRLGSVDYVNRIEGKIKN